MNIIDSIKKMLSEKTHCNDINTSSIKNGKYFSVSFYVEEEALKYQIPHYTSLLNITITSETDWAVNHVLNSKIDEKSEPDYTTDTHILIAYRNDNMFFCKTYNESFELDIIKSAMAYLDEKCDKVVYMTLNSFEEQIDSNIFNEEES